MAKSATLSRQEFLIDSFNPLENPGTPYLGAQTREKEAAQARVISCCGKKR